MPESQKSAPKPSPLLALVLLNLLFRYRPDWVTVSLRQAAQDARVSAERVSRLATKALFLFEGALEQLTRRGRPKAEPSAKALELALPITRELLEVATAILLRIGGMQRKLVRELIVGAWNRLSADFPSLTLGRFCTALAIPPRTLHAWLREPSATANSAPAAKPPAPKKPGPRRGRFRFDVLLPETQVASDTTDASAFGVALKIVGVQDVGRRDQALLDSVVVDETENAKRVIDVFEHVLKPGMQAITDQGTPFMAEATKAALESKEVEHAPQREGDPLGKSTLERAWRTLKDIGAPLLGMTDRLAEKAPCLRTPELAVPFTRVLVAALLRAYQAGARATRTAITQRGNIDPAELTRRAEQSRDRAVATERSARLLLEEIHTAYGLEGSLQTFVRCFKKYPLEALRQAEVALRQSFLNLQRPPLHSPQQFFAARTRSAYADFRNRMADRERSRLQDEVRNQAIAAREASSAAVHVDPIQGLRDALRLVASCWVPTLGLLCDGLFVRGPIARLRELHSDATAIDIARGVLHSFRLERLDDLGPAALAQIEASFERQLSVLLRSSNNPHMPPIQINTGPKQRPPPEHCMRI